MLFRQFHLNVVVVVTLCLGSTVLARQCARVHKDNPCPSGMTEYYTQWRSKKGRLETMCCYPDSKDAITYATYPYICQNTGCHQEVNFDDDLCSSSTSSGFILKTIVNGTELKFEQVMKESCTTKGGNPGIDVVCCVPGTQDMRGSTLLGVQPHQFPHNVFLQTCNGMKWHPECFCGATIYNERYVIAASHCLVNDKNIQNGQVQVVPADSIVVQVGSDIAWTGDTYTAEEIIIHPNSSLLIPDANNTLNDIALVRVDRDIQFGPKVKALPIADKDFLEPLQYADYAVIAGYGDTDTLWISSRLLRGNTRLRTTELNLLINDYPDDYADKMLFVGGIQDGTASVSTGKGDSGGPAVCRDANGYATLCGLNSAGSATEDCEKHHNEEYCYPKIFVRVSAYNDWINSVAGDQSKALVMKEPLYGKKVDQGKYEHQVHITSNDGESCGGTLLSKDIVITAAHCVVQDNGSPKRGLKVVTGVRDLTNTLGGSETFGVREIQLVDGFQRVGRSNSRSRRVAVYSVKPKPQDSYFKNDLALVKLKGETKLKSFPKLASTDPRKGGSTWGTEVALPLASNKQKDLSSREFLILDGDDCLTRLYRLDGWEGFTTPKLENNVMCGEEKYTGGSLCDRELGGGLMCPGDNGGEEVLCGVQTFRMCDFAIPTGYINVAVQREWISAVMSKL